MTLAVRAPKNLNHHYHHNMIYLYSFLITPCYSLRIYTLDSIQTIVKCFMS